MSNRGGLGGREGRREKSRREAKGGDRTVTRRSLRQKKMLQSRKFHWPSRSQGRPGLFSWILDLCLVVYTAIGYLHVDIPEFPSLPPRKWSICGHFPPAKSPRRAFL